MIERLNEEFTKEEQRWYIANLYIYMNYHPTKDFPINLETVVKIVGFKHKANAKRTLVNNFTEGEDYTIALIRKDERKNEGGFNEETIMLNIDTFKNMCMLVKTEKSKEIRKYYVKLENIYNGIVKEEIENTKNLLQEKILQIQDERIIERIIDKKMEKHKVLLNMLKYKNCVYLIELSNNMIKIGSSFEIDKRKDQIKLVFGGEGIFLDIFECKSFRNIERNILNDPIIQENKFKDKLETGHVSYEVVKLSDNFTYEQLVEIVETHVRNFDFLTPSQILEKQKLDIIESFVNRGESLSDIINVFKTSLIVDHNVSTPSSQKKEQVIIPQKDIVSIKPNYGKQIQKIDPNNLTRIVQLYKNMETLMEYKKYDTYSETGIRNAIKNNTIYKKYRWVFVNENEDPMVVNGIQPTVVSKKSGCSIVLELNNDKSKITRHFNSINVGSQELKMDSRAIKKLITTNTCYNNHYYLYLDDCTPELLQTYDNKLLNYIPSSAIKVKSIDPETKQEQFFPSLKHAHDSCKVHHKALHKAITEKKILNGFYWELA